MSGQRIRAVIGKGFGDEGKGHAVDHFCSMASDSLVIKHNGGAQAGHTVELEGKRFVFHQLSAGSFRHSDTLWADTYYPDLFKLREEAGEFLGMSGFVPRIFACGRTPVTLIDDVLINMLLETMRGEERHGSCGMGINEAFLRTQAGFGMTVAEFLGKSVRELTLKALWIREEYGRKRLAGEGMAGDVWKSSAKAVEYTDLLKSKVALENAVEEMARGAEAYVSLCEAPGRLLREKEEVVFETGQGLLLDAENQEYMPHVSASRTGLHNPVQFLEREGLTLHEAIYVTRTYVTRHGAGPLFWECDGSALGLTGEDLTNVPNPWQGSIRYARHGNVTEFLAPVKRDLAENGREAGKGVSLFLTHVDETKGIIKMADGEVTWKELLSLPDVNATFDRCYLAEGREARDVKVHVLR